MLAAIEISLLIKTMLFRVYSRLNIASHSLVTRSKEEEKMKALFYLAIFLNVQTAFCEPAQTMLLSYFGDYLDEDEYSLEIDVNTDSVAKILEKLNVLRDNRHNYQCDKKQSDLVIIGYGNNTRPEHFFAATKNIYDTKPLAKAIKSMPNRQEDGVWYVYFVSKYLSHLVLKPNPSKIFDYPGWLTKIGLRPLEYFGQSSKL